jgi:protein gp37
MSDLFQDPVPDRYVEAVTAVMLSANWHTYQVLTKRAERLKALLATKLCEGAAAQHIWWGVSVEDRKYGLPRIDNLREAPAQSRFLSVEPLVEDLGRIDLTGINWVIVGGESGPGRPTHAKGMGGSNQRPVRAPRRRFSSSSNGAASRRANTGES